MTEALQGANALRARLNAVGTVASGTNEHAIARRWQLATIRQAKILVPRKTGVLGRSIHFREVVSATGAEVYASANYAPFVEFGTRPHDIAPRLKKALRFAASPGGARLSGSPRSGAPVVFARRVHHPGTRPHPFLKPAAQYALSKIGMGQIVVDLWNGAA